MESPGKNERSWEDRSAAGLALGRAASPIGGFSHRRRSSQRSRKKEGRWGGPGEDGLGSVFPCAKN